MNEEKTYWLDRHRFLTIAIILIIMWIIVILFFYFKADEITKDPCRICAERKGDKVMCFIGGIIPQSETYYPNGTEVKNKYVSN